MRASMFSKNAKISSDVNEESQGTGGSFSLKKEDNFSIIQTISGDNPRVLPVKIMDIPPTTVQSIEDTKGRLSNIVDNYCIETGEVCIPLEITQILPQVKNLKRYDIVEYEGRRFATSDIIREDVIQEFKNSIIKNLSEGLSYEATLEQDFKYKGMNLKNLKLTAKEQSFLVSIFRNYHAYICYSKEKNSLMLKVDGIIE